MTIFVYRRFCPNIAAAMNSLVAIVIQLTLENLLTWVSVSVLNCIFALVNLLFSDRVLGLTSKTPDFLVRW